MLVLRAEVKHDIWITSINCMVGQLDVEPEQMQGEGKQEGAIVGTSYLNCLA